MAHVPAGPLYHRTLSALFSNEVTDQNFSSYFFVTLSLLHRGSNFGMACGIKLPLGPPTPIFLHVNRLRGLKLSTVMRNKKCLKIQNIFGNWLKIYLIIILDFNDFPFLFQLVSIYWKLQSLENLFTCVDIIILFDQPPLDVPSLSLRQPMDWFILTFSTSQWRRCCCTRVSAEEAEFPFVVGDTCSGCHSAALRQACGTGDFEVLYATFHVDVAETPFFVALDYDHQSVIVSIRGTISMKVSISS